MASGSVLTAARKRIAPDAVGPLTVFAVLLLVVPSRLIFSPLGGAGTPAQVVGIALAIRWVALRLAAPYRISHRAPVLWAMLGFAAAVLASYVVATCRPIDPVELRSADMGLLNLCAWLGVILTLTYGVGSFERLDVLLRRVVVLGGVIATFGIVQFATGESFLQYLQIPGLSANSASTVITDRSGFNRPAGTALHPIEFGAVLTMLLPLALHFAMRDRGRSLVRRWWPVAAIAIALPIAISRSAIVGATVVLAFVLPAWSVSVRRRAYGVLVLLAAVLFVVVPGLLGTLSGLFTGIGSDTSAQSRTGSYALAGEFIARSPVFGRGFLTFLPSYRILDNQYLGLIIDAGFVGLIALLAVFLTGIFTAREVYRNSPDARVRNLAQAVAASIAAIAVEFALFDAFSFPMAASMAFFVVGLGGAVHRLSATASTPGPTA